MVSTTSVLIDLAWALGLGGLGAALAWQFRLMLRRKRAAPPPPSAGRPDPGKPLDLALPRRRTIRCPACVHPFQVLLDANVPPAVLTCPNCGLSAPFRPGSRPIRSASGAVAPSDPPSTVVGPTVPAN